ncbi:MAG: YkuS family protein [Firmicutes bacterium]|nr:YkuS family protein [Bacillota bacterium]
MARKKIALDIGLSNYRQFLQEEGYEVIDLKQEGPTDADAVLIAGRDKNAMGMTHRATDAFIMDVTGRQPEEVLYDLRKHFNLQGDGPRTPV